MSEHRSRPAAFVRDNGLTLAFLTLLLAALIGQSISGVELFNAQQLASGGEQISWAGYLVSSEFAVDVAENWQSEYLQFALYIVATVWLVQRGSSESKKPEEIGTGSDAEQKVGRYAEPDSPRWARVGGLRTAVYGRSLGILMSVFFLGSLLAQSIAGRAAYNHDQLLQQEDPVSWAGYVGSADFWNRTLQNWQSEFLAVASMAAFAIFLRQRGSPESKPVGASHQATGSG
jgi:membrane protein implicated in regulation of membrane protease activity